MGVIDELACSTVRFSAQPRADGDEAGGVRMAARGRDVVSVLNREPMGMKRDSGRYRHARRQSFSAQPRADGDEAPDHTLYSANVG